jgi:transposase
MQNGHEVFFLDESGFILTNYNVYGWYLKGSQPVKPFVFNSRRRTYLAGAFSTKGFIIAKQYKHVNGDTFAAFVKDMVNSYPKLVLIMDNVSTHFTKTLLELYKSAKIVVVRLPKYSPQLNPIEQYWKNIKQWLGTCPPLTFEDLKKRLDVAIQDHSLTPKTYGYLVT